MESDLSSNSNTTIVNCNIFTIKEAVKILSQNKEKVRKIHSNNDRILSNISNKQENHFLKTFSNKKSFRAVSPKSTKSSVVAIQNNLQNIMCRKRTDQFGTTSIYNGKQNSCTQGLSTIDTEQYVLKVNSVSSAEHSSILQNTNEQKMPKKVKEGSSESCGPRTVVVEAVIESLPSKPKRCTTSTKHKLLKKTKKTCDYSTFDRIEELPSAVVTSHGPKRPTNMPLSLAKLSTNCENPKRFTTSTPVVHKCENVFKRTISSELSNISLGTQDLLKEASSTTVNKTQEKLKTAHTTKSVSPKQLKYSLRHPRRKWENKDSTCDNSDKVLPTKRTKTKNNTAWNFWPSDSDSDETKINSSKPSKSSLHPKKLNRKRNTKASKQNKNKQSKTSKKSRYNASVFTFDTVRKDYHSDNSLISDDNAVKSHRQNHIKSTTFDSSADKYNFKFIFEKPQPTSPTNYSHISEWPELEIEKVPFFPPVQLSTEKFTSSESDEPLKNLDNLSCKASVLFEDLVHAERNSKKSPSNSSSTFRNKTVLNQLRKSEINEVEPTILPASNSSNLINKINRHSKTNKAISLEDQDKLILSSASSCENMDINSNYQSDAYHNITDGVSKADIHSWVATGLPKESQEVLKKLGEQMFTSFYQNAQVLLDALTGEIDPSLTDLYDRLRNVNSQFEKK